MTLKELFPDYFTGAIFTAVEKVPSYNFPWKESGIMVDTINLDVQYVGNHSGGKLISPLVSDMVKNNALPAEALSRLASIMVSLYGLKWKKLWDTLVMEYNPIENFRSEETETTTNDGTVTNDSKGTTSRTGEEKTNISNSENYTESMNVKGSENVNGDKKFTVDETDTENRTETNTDTVKTVTTGKNDMGVFGFDSKELSPHDSTTQTGNTDTTSNQSKQYKGDTVRIGNNDETETRNTTRNDDTTKNGNKSGTTTDTKTYTDTQTDTASANTKTNDTGTRKLLRFGNIGVTTSQQMIQAERDLWFWDFFGVLFSDLDYVLTIPIY